MAASVYTPNELFRAARERLYGSREALADATNTYLAPGFLVTPNDIGKIERGVVTFPRKPRRDAFRKALRVETDALIGFFDARSFAPAHCGQAGIERPVERPDSDPGSAIGEGQQAACARGGGDHPTVAPVVEGGGAYAGFLSRVVATARRTSEYAMETGAFVVPEFTIEQLTEDAVDIARGFTLRTPTAAVTEALGVHDRVLAAMNRTRRPAQQTTLLLLAGQTAVLLASAGIDLGLWEAARRYARAAYGYGDMIGHAGVLAYARGMQATVAYWTGKPAEAVDYALAAVAIAPPGVASVRAQCILARAWAHRGAPDEVSKALRNADTARLAEGTDYLHDVIGGEFGFSVPQQARCASTAWLQVDRPAEAASAAEAALHLIEQQDDPSWEGLEAEVRLDLASCQLLTGRPDAAHATMSRAEATLLPLWGTPTDHRRIGLFGRIERLTALLSAPEWQKLAEAQQMLQLAERFSAARPAVPALPPA